MGLYIETPGVEQGKAAALKTTVEARYIGGPPAFETVPEDELLIAVKTFPSHEAALICSNRVDYERALYERSRPVTWLQAPRERVLAELRAQGVDEGRLEAYEVTKGE
jgi:hypothetical protein